MWGVIPNPFEVLGAGAAKLMAEGWTMVMLSLWGAGLWLTRVVLQLLDFITTPDLSADGPAKVVYQYMFGIAFALFMLLLLCQLGVALIRRDGATLGRAVWGAVQFQFAGIMWVTWCVVVFAGAGGLTRVLLQTLLKVDAWADYQPFGTFEASDITDAVVATVIGVMGIFMVISAIAHVVILLVSSTTALVIAVTGIVSAAGLPFEPTRRWFWMSFRWFHAAAFTPVVLVLVLGLGTQFTQGTIIEGSDTVTQDIAGAVIGIVLLCISCFAPMALFKLLAFVDPGTNSGAALRAGMNASGGLQGVLGGNRNGHVLVSGSASEVDDLGRSSAERSGEADTSNRLAQQGSQAAGQGLGMIPGIGGAAAGILGAMRTIGSQGAVVGADIANQAGIGHNSYVPDYRDNPNTSGSRNQQAQQQPDVNGTDTPPSPAGQGSAQALPSPQPTTAPGSAAAPAAAGGSGAATAGAGAGAAGGGAAAGAAVASVPPVIP